jgi:hypothetical protein
VSAAIVIVGPEAPPEGDGPRLAPTFAAKPSAEILACVEVVGQSVLERTIENLWRTGVSEISIFVDRSLTPFGFSDGGNTSLHPTNNVWRDAAAKFEEYREAGVDTVWIVRVGPHIEMEFADMMRFHSERGPAITRAVDSAGPLEVWVAHPERFSGNARLPELLLIGAERYGVSGYVNRLETPRDLRRLAVDSLTSRCRLRPQGLETRSGVWMAPGAQVDRGARIVAPVFIGRGAKISEQCLITRCSSVESNCDIDYGTVVEDSSILAGTYVGIGLDLSHSVVEGDYLLNLRHDVMLRINDPVVLRHVRTDKNHADRSFVPDFGVEEGAISSFGERTQ